MTPPRPKFTPEPRILNEFQVACRLGWATSTFRDRKEGLESKGFPRRDRLLGGWDVAAIEQWLDRRSGVGAPSSGREWLEAVDGAENEPAVSE